MNEQAKRDKKDYISHLNIYSVRKTYAYFSSVWFLVSLSPVVSSITARMHTGKSIATITHVFHRLSRPPYHHKKGLRYSSFSTQTDLPIVLSLVRACVLIEVTKDKQAVIF